MASLAWELPCEKTKTRSRDGGRTRKWQRWHKQINSPPLPATRCGQFNLISSPNPRTDQYDQHIVRIDQVISDKHRFFARYVRGNRHEVNSDAGFRHDASPWYTHALADQPGRQLRSHLCDQSYLVSAFRASYIRHQFAIARYGDGFDATQFGFPSSLVAQMPRKFFPQIAYTDYTTFGNTGSQFTFSDTWSLSETLSKVLGKHSLRFGGEYRMIFNNQQNPTS